MTTWDLRRPIVRAMACAVVGMLSLSAIVIAQTPSGVRCADGAVVTTVAICNQLHHGVAKVDARMMPYGGGAQTSTPPDTSKHTGSMEINGFSQGVGRQLNATTSPTPSSIGGIPAGSTVPLVKPPSGNSGGMPAPTGQVSLPPGVVIPPPDTTTKQPKGKSP